MLLCGHVPKTPVEYKTCGGSWSSWSSVSCLTWRGCHVLGVIPVNCFGFTCYKLNTSLQFNWYLRWIIIPMNQYFLRWYAELKTFWMLHGKSKCVCVCVLNSIRYPVNDFPYVLLTTLSAFWSPGCGPAARGPAASWCIWTRDNLTRVRETNILIGSTRSPALA